MTLPATGSWPCWTDPSGCAWFAATIWTSEISVLAATNAQQTRSTAWYKDCEGQTEGLSRAPRPGHLGQASRQESAEPGALKLQDYLSCYSRRLEAESLCQCLVLNCRARKRGRIGGPRLGTGALQMGFDSNDSVEAGHVLIPSGWDRGRFARHHSTSTSGRSARVLGARHTGAHWSRPERTGARRRHGRRLFESPPATIEVPVVPAATLLSVLMPSVLAIKHHQMVGEQRDDVHEQDHQWLRGTVAGPRWINAIPAPALPGILGMLALVLEGRPPNRNMVVVSMRCANGKRLVLNFQPKQDYDADEDESYRQQAFLRLEREPTFRGKSRGHRERVDLAHCNLLIARLAKLASLCQGCLESRGWDQGSCFIRSSSPRDLHPQPAVLAAAVRTNGPSTSGVSAPPRAPSSSKPPSAGVSHMGHVPSPQSMAAREKRLWEGSLLAPSREGGRGGGDGCVYARGRPPQTRPQLRGCGQTSCAGTSTDSRIDASACKACQRSGLLSMRAQVGAAGGLGL
ncbi:hypothetical protein G7046_g5220 [Stylonectria norvegica]|nr:hypothetical protein G7046_g5220 [Stylonectria norvegica]